jgi:hypothetical protein
MRRNLSFASQDTLADAVADAEVELGNRARRLFHLSVPPVASAGIVSMLGATGLSQRARVILEKPYGTELASARALNQTLHPAFAVLVAELPTLSTPTLVWPTSMLLPGFSHDPISLGERAEEWPDEHGDIIGATPYSLRRGMISLRIRAGEDRQTIAKQCGTSVEMLERSYSFAIEDLEDEGPRPAAEERIRARQLALAGRRRQLRVA